MKYYKMRAAYANERVRLLPGIAMSFPIGTNQRKNRYPEEPQIKPYVRDFAPGYDANIRDAYSSTERSWNTDTGPSMDSGSWDTYTEPPPGMAAPPAQSFNVPPPRNEPPVAPVFHFPTEQMDAPGMSPPPKRTHRPMRQAMANDEIIGMKHSRPHEDWNDDERPLRRGQSSGEYPATPVPQKQAPTKGARKAHLLPGIMKGDFTNENGTRLAGGLHRRNFEDEQALNALNLKKQKKMKQTPRNSPASARYNKKRG